MVVAYLWWIPHLYNGLQDPQSLHGQNLCAHARSAVLLRSFDEVPSNYVNVIHRPEGKLGLLGEEVYRDYVTLSGGEDALGVGITDECPAEASHCIQLCTLAPSRREATQEKDPSVEVPAVTVFQLIP
ncbi:hypothetical protein BC938DRAFT_471053 [Jimgerdemannia flammicorona]|uniref:Uncharacterized protein n=1 Tax=Jimgerdemannia flammicorona TaxID=994334 RepID=A0A433Q8V7_9FUNG|nr:hypothetical protein BC938DRAFT_471053 [Jimgerdemannia flammicorona]